MFSAFYFRKLPTIFINSLDVFGICSNGAFEENLEMEMIYFEEMVNSSPMNSPT